MSMLHKVAEFFTPVLKESKFRETGVITPDEFVIAGDYLVHHCPTWSWHSGEQSKIKSYLPENKQYLMTKQVPCYKRYKDLESIKFNEKIIDENDEEGGWVDAHLNESSKDNDDKVQEIELGEEAIEQSLKPKSIPSQTETLEEEDDDSEAEDIEKYMQRQNVCDENDKCVYIEDKIDPNLKNNEIVATRTYDLYITYDKYYQTPRLWLSGFDEYFQPLSIHDMFEDISEDHAKKTVTMEWHPHFNGMMASVHPCRHAEMMKKIITTMENNEKVLEVDRYLVIFLKFVQTVIPTIQYDFTQNVFM
ncbi:Ubiquitin-like-conjugating enzyme ATG3 [Sarcoptes scabiei]|uniref:Ubiquitin-like-conjugating enzyme ATG3 n=1 Tax=Sarcoptes scabiei TaxID=52283 RepID=A0A131ZYJ8_SARSC|nr:Ubiquitin-like-conjugating enzyme ATG3 [Sarcoptes scabiei]KPM03190.1 ubiquitin-like protein-conjugating enzyme ATG3-like protein [Sarcoptes scabiei]